MLLLVEIEETGKIFIFSPQNHFCLNKITNVFINNSNKSKKYGVATALALTGIIFTVIKIAGKIHSSSSRDYSTPIVFPTRFDDKSELF